MENNIFEGAKFGDKFLTRDGRMAILISQNKNGYILAVYSYCLYVPQKISSECHPYNERGQNYRFNDDIERYDDIVSHYQEPIDEEKLDELAHNHCMNNGYSGCDEDEYIEDHSTTWGNVMYDIENAYKSGYRKAKEE